MRLSIICRLLLVNLKLMQYHIVFQAYGGIFLPAGMKKGIKYDQNQSSVMLLSSIILGIMLLF